MTKIKARAFAALNEWNAYKHTYVSSSDSLNIALEKESVNKWASLLSDSLMDSSVSDAEFLIRWHRFSAGFERVRDLITVDLLKNGKRPA